MKKHLAYEGFITPIIPEATPMTVLQPPEQPQIKLGKKFEKLLEKISAEEAGAQTSSEPERGVAVASTQQANVETATASESKSNTSASKEQTAWLNFLQSTKSNSDPPLSIINRIESCLPEEILERMDSVFTASPEMGTYDFSSYLDQWQSTETNLLNFESKPSLSPVRPDLLTPDTIPKES